MTAALTAGTQSKLEGLFRQLCDQGSVLVAFSGGADSAFLLAAAVRALGAGGVVAATAISPSLPASELDSARAFACGLGVEHLTPSTRELDREDYVRNGRDRCFFCKSELMSVLVPIAQSRGIAAVATGTNADDARDPFRPGIRAAALAGAIAPIRDADLTKSEVREVSALWGLPTAHKPASACLSSRIAYGLTISRGRLSRVERAEAHLRRRLNELGLGVENLRVRDHGTFARVELDSRLLPRSEEFAHVLTELEGFAEVQLDPQGFRSGSMNERGAEL